MTTPLPIRIDLPWLSAKHPGLELQPVFSGWWPSRGAFMPSGSFKDLEAAAVVARLGTQKKRIVVLASAGNTAAAFATLCSKIHRPCVIVVAEEALSRIRIPHALGESVSVVAITGGATYDDAIALSRALIDDELFVLEGGVRNVARRDGMGIALGVALEADPRMPDVYMQAIGSAAGAIAVLETAIKAQARDASLTLPKLALSQNAPFTPVARSYARRSPMLLREEDSVAKMQIATIMAPVLTNMAPPYEIAGGIYESVKLSRGDVVGVTNAAALSLQREFLTREGVQLDGAAAVTLAGIAKFPPNLFAKGSRVLVHLTGGIEKGDSYRPRVALSSTYSIDHRLAQTQNGIAHLREQLSRRYR